MFSNVSKLDIFIPVEALWLKISFKLSPGKIHAVSLTWQGEERKVLTFSELISASIICKQIIRNLSWLVTIVLEIILDFLETSIQGNDIPECYW